MFQPEAVLGLNSNQLEGSQILEKLEKIKVDPPPGVKDQVNLTDISLSGLQEICDVRGTVVPRVRFLWTKHPSSVLLLLLRSLSIHRSCSASRRVVRVCMLSGWSQRCLPKEFRIS